jgi:mTERF
LSLQAPSTRFDTDTEATLASFTSTSTTTGTPEERQSRWRRLIQLQNDRNNNNDDGTSNVKKRPKPPLIDSDLLRFLNTTQTLWSINGNDDDRCNINNCINAAASTVSPTSDSVRIQQSELRNPANITSYWDESGIEDQMMQDWMKQYECTYIVTLLHEQHGATIEAAFAVGTTIERIARVRAQQKRLRSYWKLRNQIWKQTNYRDDTMISASNSSILGDHVVSTENESFLSAAVVEDSEDGDMCEILPFRNDCSNHNNMDDIVHVMMQYGLSAKDICEILMASPSIAFMQPRRELSLDVGSNVTEMAQGRGSSDTQQSLQDILDRILNGLLMGSNQPYQLKLRKYDARKVLRNTPGILTVRGSESAYQIVQLLISLGVSTNSLSRDKNNLPILLSRQPNEVFRLVAFLSSDAVRMPISNIGPLLRRTEGQDLLNAIAPSRASSMMRQSRFVDTQKQSYANQNVFTLYNGLLRGANSKRTTPSYVATQIQKVVVNDIYRRMSETAWTLRNKIGTNDLGRVIAAYPSVLLLDAARQILPTAQYLMNELDILPNDLPSILQLYPVLLRTDVDQMRNVVSYLTSLAVAEDNLGTIFRSFPVLLTLDIEHDMEPVVEFLKSIGVSNVGRFISRLPPILGYSVENELRPKFDYLHSISADARFKITKFPAYFSYPLERVIKSRFEYLRNVKRIPTPLLSLDHILCSGDKDFAVKVCQDANVTQYAQFMQDRQEDMRRQSSHIRRDASNAEEPLLANKQETSQKEHPSDTKRSNRDTKAMTPPRQGNQTSFPPGAAAITS